MERILTPGDVRPLHNPLDPPLNIMNNIANVSNDRHQGLNTDFPVGSVISRGGAQPLRNWTEVERSLLDPMY